MRLFGFLLLWGIACTVGARDYHVLPAGAGEKSGATWEQAADAAGAQRLLDALQPGDRLLLGSGEYRDFQVVIRTSGAAGKPIVIAGQDRGGGLPVLSSDWSIEKPSKGATAFVIAPGASRVVVRDLVVRNYAHGVRGNFAPGETPRAGWRFENVDMDHIRHGFYLSGFADLQLTGCDLKRYSKHGFRLDAACSNVKFERCTADCSEGDPKWEEKTELLPVGFVVNDGGAPNRDIVFAACEARNHMMPLQKNRYKNGDGFVVEGNAENVAFRGCRSLRNQDGGYDLKVKDVRLEDCIAIGNKRNFRIWTTGTLTNCYSGGGQEGLWTKGGPVIAERCTIAAWKGRAISTEDADAGFELRRCLLAADGAANPELPKLVKLVDCVQSASLEEAGLKQVPETWIGKAAELNSSKHSDRGFRAGER